MHKFATPVATVTLLSLAAMSSAQFFDNFDVDSTANWTVNQSAGTHASNVFFDYSTVGIPSANGSGGTTRGLMMAANVSGGVFGGLSASPTGQNFTGDFTLSADVWLNFIGPAPAGGSGSTQIGGIGIGTAGTAPQFPGVADGVWFAATGDGGSSADWRAYSSAAPASYQDGDPVYFASTRNSSNPYYSGFGNVTIPASQTALFPGQTGATQVGAAGFAWHQMVVSRTGNQVLWTVSGTPIAQVDVSNMTLGGGNISLNSSDINATSSSTVHGLTFALYDNVRVTPVPEPATMAVLGLGAAALLRRRRK